MVSDYQTSGEVRVVPPNTTRYLVPWFVISKPEGDKVKDRLICDCRQLNQYLTPKPFLLDHLQNIFPYLRKNQWAAKIDLKDAYFHLALAKELFPFVHLQVGKFWSFRQPALGISTLPQKFMSLMRVFEKLWRQRGIMCFIYLDDILVLGNNPPQVQKDLEYMVKTLVDSGIKINLKKSVLEPVQEVSHLGFTLYFKQRSLQVAPGKLKAVRKELEKLVTYTMMSCRKMAAILGTVRGFLVALPFLREFTDSMVQFVNQQQTFWRGYQQSVPPKLKAQIKEVKNLLKNWQGRPFLKGGKPKRKFYFDSSTLAWSGLDLSRNFGGKSFPAYKCQRGGGCHSNGKSLARPKESVLL